MATAYNASVSDNAYELARERIPGDKLGQRHTRHAWRQRTYGGPVYVVRNVSSVVDGQYIQTGGLAVDASTPRERWYSSVQLAAMERARQRRLVRIGLHLDRHMAALARQWSRARALAASRAQRARNRILAALRATRQWLRLDSAPTLRRDMHTGRLATVTPRRL